MHKGAAAPLWGEPAAATLASVFGWRAACFRRGGTPSRPGFPRRGNGKGEIKFLAAAGQFLCTVDLGNRLEIPPS